MVGGSHAKCSAVFSSPLAPPSPPLSFSIWNFTGAIGDKGKIISAALLPGIAVATSSPIGIQAPLTNNGSLLNEESIAVSSRALSN